MRFSKERLHGIGWCALVALVAAAVLVGTRSAHAPLSAVHEPDLEWQQALSVARERTFNGHLDAPVPYLPMATVSRGAGGETGAAQLPPQIQIATANAIDRANPLSSNSLREAGVAHLFRGQSNAAIRQLNAAATLSGTAGAWSDLAVAYIAECEARSDLGFCVDALACTDRAIAADESYPPARFNRALALQKLGFVAQASEEWRRSERTERDVRWAAEAARRRGDLPAQTPEWSSVAAELESAAATGDHSAMMRLIRVVPRDARSRGESVYLASWGEAFLAGKESEARRNLVIAREIGRALERNAGERMLRDAVAVVDRAIQAHNRAALVLLATAHVAFRDGRAYHAQSRSSAAEESFRRAESLFVRAESPMANVARYYLGSALYIQSRASDAWSILSTLDRDSLERTGYRGLVGQIGWEYGLLLVLRGQYTDGLHVLEHSAALFAALDEQENRAAIEDFIASALEFIDDPSAAWTARQRALATLSTFRATDRIVVSVATAAAAAARRGEWTRAKALLNLAVDMAMASRNATQIAAALTQRARVFHALGDAPSARRDLETAETWIGQISDIRTADRIDADRRIAEGLQTNDPHAAIASFTHALEYFEDNGLTLFTTQALLERARAYRRAGKLARARADLRNGLTALELQRRTIASLDQRAVMFAASKDLFTEAIAIALARGQEEEAFDLAERARGRALRDFLHRSELREGVADAAPMTLRTIQNALAIDAAVLTFDFIEDGLVAFVVRPASLRVVRTKIDRQRLVALAESCGSAIRERQTVESQSGCHDVATFVLAPVADALLGAHTIGLVPGEILATLPLDSVMVASGNPLGRAAAIVEAPSASILIECSLRAHPIGKGETLLIGATTHDERRFPDAEVLPHIPAEMRAVASIRGATRLLSLSGTQVTKERLLRAMPQAALIHFAGHAVIDRLHPARSRLLIDSSSEEQDITAADIAAMKLDPIQLVYLSACRSGTAAGRVDGVESLAVAFIVAGAPSVVASRWDLPDDAAAELSAQFHRAFVDTNDAAAALHLIRSRTGDHPGAERAMRVVGGSASLVNQHQ